jgi:hypothetical protein
MAWLSRLEYTGRAPHFDWIDSPKDIEYVGIGKGFAIDPVRLPRRAVQTDHRALAPVFAMPGWRR